MGDAFGAEQIARRVARANTRVAFVFGSGLGPAEPNFGVFDNWIDEPAYLSGMIAGKLTKTNMIGSVAAMAIPEVDRLGNAFCAGAKEVNTTLKCKLSFIGSFFDPPKAKEAALAADRRRRRRHLRRALRRDRSGKEKGVARLLQHVRSVLARPRHGRHRPGLGHVADHPGGDQAGPGRASITAQDFGSFS